MDPTQLSERTLNPLPETPDGTRVLDVSRDTDDRHLIVESKPCQHCEADVVLEDEHIAARVRVPQSGAPTVSSTVFCDSNCYREWVTGDLLPGPRPATQT